MEMTFLMFQKEYQESTHGATVVSFLSYIKQTAFINFATCVLISGQICELTTYCKYWSWYESGRFCYLKNADAWRSYRYLNSHISGEMGCK